MTHKFIVNTENVNEVGYRILTDGIDYTQYLRNPVVLFMHVRDNYQNRGSEVIGRCVKLYVENNQLIAEVEFDEKDEFAQKIAGKVERGFIRMASMYADVVATSNAAEDVLPGQVYETVTKCKLVEISIVDIGGNDDALKLSKSANAIGLKKVNNPNNEDMQKIALIALALGMTAESTEDSVLQEVTALKLAKTNADNKVIELSGKLNSILTTEATALVDQAVSLGLIPDSLKSVQLKAFEGDHEGQKAILSKLISDKEAENNQGETHKGVKEIVLKSNTTPNGAADSEQSFDYLQKHNVVELGRIRDNEPEKYAKLAKEYADGKRYTEKK
ncbi:HK97 family phage prohead protease [Flavobacterium sp. DG1-102-2]|uniref:HK97 family phage prohead protease n=1 Tax=Flavobacterium sp. DG1-102-2 TaxID=3081663 RepID=UPI002949F0E0|nr:HK97 family phage prohead protease [Flavobacterium sp. DG1-102-2]MDV6170227.1 HK97 family phage prohead protease [Flavobacterium sp. DG1-102-2]